MLQKKQISFKKIKGFSKDVPFYVQGDTKNKKCIIFISGLGGNGASFFNKNFDKYFPNYFGVSFDMRGQSSNKNKSSKFRRRYIRDLVLIINFIKKLFPNKILYIAGESWGSSLAFLYIKKTNDNDIEKVIGWNMPYSIINNENRNIKKPSFWDNSKVVFTYLTNISTYRENKFDENLTNNRALVKINEINNKKNPKQNNKLPIACWKSLKVSWKYYLLNSNNKKLFYIQSLEDILRTQKIIDNNKDKIMILEKGTHILSLDSESSGNLYKVINEILEK